MTEQHPPIFRRPDADVVPERRFQGDLYEREALAERLTGFLSRLPDGAVMAIDSPWGDGKTWFGKRWRASLVDAGYRTAYIDCFQKDHLDDPFAMVTGEIIELAKQSKSKTKRKLLETGKKLGVALLPAAAKFGVNTVGHWAIGKADLAEDLLKAGDALEKSAAAGLEKLVAKRLEDYEADKKAVESFKETLAELAAEDDKPIIVFLDELDRCRPDFAVRTIERVKHFFEAPKVIFILFLNRRQLVAAIEGMYGPRVDAEAYLGKFIQLSLKLPKRHSLDLDRSDDNRRHCEATLLRYGFPITGDQKHFVTMMGVLSTYFGMSLRDVERAVTLFSFGQPVHSSAIYVAWPIALKIAKPNLFSRLLENDREAHREAYELGARLSERVPRVAPVTNFFAELHNCGSQGFETKLPPEEAKTLSSLSHYGGPKEFVKWVFERVDLSLSV